MNPRLLLAVLACFLPLVARPDPPPPAPAPPTASPAAILVDQILLKPGYESQGCAAFMPVADPPFIAFTLSDRGRLNSIIPANFLKLRAHRAAIIAELSARLQPLASNATRPPDSPPSGISDVEKLDLQLLMLIDLNAVEILPLLLRVEQALHPLPPMADIAPNSSQPAPSLANITADLNPAEALEFHRHTAPADYPDKSQWYVKDAQWILRDHVYTQRAVLGVIAALLRQQKYPPLLQSDLENRFESGLSAIGPAGVSNPLDLSPQERTEVIFDPVCHLPYYSTRGVAIPYTPALRDEIIAWARDYLKIIPPEKLDGTPGMLRNPVMR